MDLICNPTSYKRTREEKEVYEQQLGNVNMAGMISNVEELFFIVFRYNGILIMCF